MEKKSPNTKAETATATATDTAGATAPSPSPLSADDFRLENWKRIWQCRDFELSHLWQRSIFLTAFLLLIYSSYGMFWKDQLLKADGNLIDSVYMCHLISMGISTLGVVFSILWIAMGKGSKFWYEAYEEKIQQVEGRYDAAFNSKEYTTALNAHDVLDLVSSKKINECVLSCKAARYSPSKINIMIGIVSLFVWVILFVIHLLFFIHKTGGWDLSKSTTTAPILGTIIFICLLCKMVKTLKSH